ncbi:MAG: ABC transporter permease [Acetobacteraceae bacterium]|nr:ABC transporter permease [Acetobacteraceae bacterium]
MRTLILMIVWGWLGIFLAAPLAIIFFIALAGPAPGIPPISLGLYGENFAALVQDDYYLSAFVRSLEIAAVSTLACLLLGYPMALRIARAPARWRPASLLAVMLPFWTGFLLRITAWIGLLKDDGWIDTAVTFLGLPPLRLLYTDAAMYIGITYAYLPFMVLPLYARLSKRDPALEEAAADLGARPWRVFWRITLPLSAPGIWAGVLLVFIPAVGEYIIPELLGGPGAQTVGRVLWGEFFENRDWPIASALACALVIVLVLPAAIWQWRQGPE